MIKFGVACLAMLTLSACAGRPPEIAPLVQVSDRHLSCEQVQAEAKINTDRMSDLATEQNWKLGQNMTAGIVGFFAWPAWAGLDFQNAAGQEAKALSQRNEYLMAIAEDKCRPASQTASATETDSLPFARRSPSTHATTAEISSSLVSR